MSEVQITMIPAEHAFALWPKVRAHIAGATARSHGRYDPEDVLESVITGEHTLWVAFDGKDVLGAVTSYPIDYPRKRVMFVHFCGGTRLKDWSHEMFRVIQHWAYDNKCVCIESNGRDGWARIFKDDGFEPIWTGFELPAADCGLGG